MVDWWFIVVIFITFVDKIHYTYKLCTLLFDDILSDLCINTIYRKFKSFRVFYKLTNCNLLLVHILKYSVILLILKCRLQLNTVDNIHKLIRYFICYIGIYC